MPVVFITKDDEVSKKKTGNFYNMAGGEREIEKQIILVEKENAIVSSKPEDVERMNTFLYKGYENPPGMQNFMHRKGGGLHWYVPSLVEY